MPRRGMDYLFEPATAGVGGLAGLSGRACASHVLRCLLVAGSGYLCYFIKEVSWHDGCHDNIVVVKIQKVRYFLDMLRQK